MHPHDFRRGGERMGGGGRVERCFAVRNWKEEMRIGNDRVI